MIKAPFNYMGSKARHWKFIKEVFETHKKETFVDPFAGSFTTPLSIKEAFPEVTVLANVKDEPIESMLSFSHNELKEKYLELLDIMTEGGRISIKEARNNKESFNKLRNNYNAIFNYCCECCGHKLKKKEADRLTHTTAQTLCDINPNNTLDCHSLGYSAFNQDKLDTLEKWFTYLSQIEVTKNYFNDTLVYNNYFIHLDPPYIETVKAKNKGFVGFNYSNLGDGGVAWTYEDNEKLVNFISHNLNKNNAILLWGSKGNHLESLVRKYLDGEYYEFSRRQNIMGSSKEVSEYAFLIY